MFRDYIFVAPSFRLGVARVLDLGATLDDGSYLMSASPEEADARALASDFRVVGRDIAHAMEAHEQATEEEEAAAA